MKSLSIQVLAIAIILVCGTAGCTVVEGQFLPTKAPALKTAVTQPAAPTAIPVTQDVPVGSLPSATVLQMVERLNAGDVEGSLAHFTDEAMVYFFGLPPIGTEIYHGKEQFRAVWEDSVTNHFQWEVEISSVVGDVVNVRAKTWHDFTRQLGVAPLEYTDVYVIKDGKILSYVTTITEESLARFKPAFAEIMPPEPDTTPSSDTPQSELTVTIAEGTCTTDGSMVLQPGKIQVTLDVQDQDKELYALTFFILDEGKDFLDLMASTVWAGPPDWAEMILIQELGPGKSEVYSFTAEQGPVYGVCWSKPPDLPIGAVGPFEVKQ